MKLYFRNSRNQERLLSEPPTIEDMWNDINLFMNEHKFKSYYQQICDNGERLIIDVGSHTEFFEVEGLRLEDIHKQEGEL